MASGNVLSRSILAAAFVVAAALPALSWAAPKSETARFVRETRQLEASPLQPGAEEMRRWLFNWAVETPDYQVIICPVLGLPETVDEETSIAPEVLAQQYFGNLAYQITEGSDGDELDRQLAGVESALKAYAVFMKADPSLKIPGMDHLAALKKAGTLRAHVAAVLEEKCGADAPRKTLSLDAEDAAPSDLTVFLGDFLRGTSVVYPMQVGQWQAVDERRYDDVLGGASVRFERPGDKTGWIDLYFYPAGVQEPAQRREAAEGEREALLDARREQMASERDMSPLQSMVVPVASLGPGGPARVDANVLDFRYSHEGTDYSSVMVFAIDRMYAIKLRYSVEATAASRQQARREAETFFKALLPGVEITSFGSCGGVPPEDQLRLRMGCVGVDPLLPVVGEGQRELRFEYPAPTGAAGQ
ncbi:hypothetical protein [Stenotrophomonas sp.]|uniref:hypothetical protein n=1 Tax=Stenotrophomonas sp. TaxID=69392 RepID=UPI0028AAF578|nr:hypothetical protein [Stenotrophomonas sp.]